MVLLYFVGFFPNSAIATGSFELIDFPTSFNAYLLQNFSTYINFLYSGTNKSGVGVSIIGDNVPAGISLGSVEQRPNGVNSIYYSGIPKIIGSYPLTLILTDNDGAILTKHFSLNINGLVFNNDLLPNATINKPYFTNINFYYPGIDTPSIRFYDLPDGLQFDTINSMGYNGSFTLRLTPRKAGQFTFNAVASVNYIDIGTKTFNLIVDDQPQIQTTNQTLIITPQQTIPLIKTQEKETAKIPSVIKKEIPKLNKKEIIPVKTIATSTITIEHSASSTPATIPEQQKTPILKHWYEWLNPFNWF